MKAGQGLVAALLPILIVAAPGTAGVSRTTTLAAPAQPLATADLLVSIEPGAGEHPTVGALFHLRVGVTNNGPDPSHFRIHLVVPAEVRYETGGLDCVGSTGDLTCAEADAPLGDDGSGDASLVADAPGSYTITARLTDLAATDPNPANNEASLTIDVAAQPHSFAARAFRVTPSSPRAGSTFAVSFRVLDLSAHKVVVPSSARCSVSIGQARARVLGQRAICLVSTPASAHGKLVQGMVRAIVGTASVLRRFAVRLR